MVFPGGMRTSVITNRAHKLSQAVLSSRAPVPPAPSWRGAVADATSQARPAPGLTRVRPVAWSGARPENHPSTTPVVPGANSSPARCGSTCNHSNRNGAARDERPAGRTRCSGTLPNRQRRWFADLRAFRRGDRNVVHARIAQPGRGDHAEVRSRAGDREGTEESMSPRSGCEKGFTHER